MNSTDTLISAPSKTGSRSKNPLPACLFSSSPAFPSPPLLLLKCATSQVSELGMDALKHELMRLGCKCGGSLKERAQRLLSTKGCSKRSELDTKILANAPTSEKIKNKNITRQAVDSIAKEIAVLEAQVRGKSRGVE
eukprot:470054-Hanusia_phi.AAC.2